MAVALAATLNALQIATLIRKGGDVGWKRVTPQLTTGIDIFIGAAVSRRGEANIRLIDLCAEAQAIHGFVLGLDPTEEEIPAGGYYFNDFDNPFGNAVWVRVGVPIPGGVYLVLCETAALIQIDMKLKCVDGVFVWADTNDNFQMMGEQDVAVAALTRTYFYARWVKN